MAKPARTAVYLERGPKRTFACALEWPGWCRVARGDDAALQMLVDYAPRYASVAARAGLTLPRVGIADLDVVETLQGTKITDFGAPCVPAAADLRAVDRATAHRDVALLEAAWAELDAITAEAPASLLKGPRGGGRDRDAMMQHVFEAERGYAGKVGIRMPAPEWRERGITELRARYRDVLGRAWDGRPHTERGWPTRYVIRRIAWHALDHAWEMQDKG